MVFVFSRFFEACAICIIWGTHGKKMSLRAYTSVKISLHKGPNDRLCWWMFFCTLEFFPPKLFKNLCLLILCKLPRLARPGMGAVAYWNQNLKATQSEASAFALQCLIFHQWDKPIIKVAECSDDLKWALYIGKSIVFRLIHKSWCLK